MGKHKWLVRFCKPARGMLAVSSPHNQPALPGADTIR
jgi:hypothetical protein